MNKKRVALFEFPVKPGCAPLTSGYLQTVACQDERIRHGYEFETHVLSVTLDDVLESVIACEADIYGFSTYVWNSRLVRRIVDRLVQIRPKAHIILGGSQVMHNGKSYLNPAHPRVTLCNGEGEFTFAAYLGQLLLDEPNLKLVDGLSFYRNGELITNKEVPRIKDLDQVPSPFLAGLIDPRQYPFVPYETNRGCPFKCTYCYWGGATNAKVNKFETNRVMDELTWLCENEVKYIFVIDANFGMLKRDLEIAQHIVELKKRTGFPLAVLINSSKNTPERVTDIIRLWSGVGLMSAQPVSMQTVSPTALKAIERDNIKASTYTELQRTLKADGLQSFLEMIWPLPGETLDSFKQGLDELCRMDSDSFVVYPLMLINNVEMARQRDEFELVTLADPDPNSEAEIVIATKHVTNAEYQEGINLTYHVAVLYSFMALRYTMSYLDHHGAKSYTRVSADFWEFAAGVEGNPYPDFVKRVVTTTGFDAGAGGFIALGGAVHVALHAAAKQFDDLLYAFAADQGWLDDDAIRLRFELDLFSRPLLYSNSNVLDKSPMLRLLACEAIDRDTATVHVAAKHVRQVLQLLELELPDSVGAEEDLRLKANYRTPHQIVFSPKQNVRFYNWHCQNRTRGEIRQVAPKWTICLEERDARSIGEAVLA
jgi:radical SAM superfamily enzyme YgiQ (UPF0313 family)